MDEHAWNKGNERHEIEKEKERERQRKREREKEGGKKKE